MDSNPSVVLALDVGEKRIGLARGLSSVRFASPLTTIENNADVFSQLQEIIKQEQIGLIVVGRPLNSAGEETSQTRYTASFVEDLKQHIDLAVVWQEETLTSVKAEQELAERGKPYEKAEVDALAATYILDDYFDSLSPESVGTNHA